MFSPKKQPVLGSSSSRAVHMCSRQSVSLKTRCFSQASIMSVFSSSVWKCWLKFLYPSILLRCLSMAEQSGEQPQCWNPSHHYRAMSLFITNVSFQRAILAFWLILGIIIQFGFFFFCLLSNPLSEIIVIWICFKSKKHRTFLGLGQSLSSK